MKRMAWAALLLALSSSPLFAQEAGHRAEGRGVTVDIINAQGENVGTATLTPAANGVRITFNIHNMQAGPHLVHIHANAKCEAPDFRSAGPHFNPQGAPGVPTGVMAGDIPNFVLTVRPDGTAHTSTIAPYVALGSEPNSVFANGGTALVFHAVAAQVSASAPPRIACAVVSRPQ